MILTITLGTRYSSARKEMMHSLIKGKKDKRSFASEICIIFWFSTVINIIMWVLKEHAKRCIWNLKRIENSLEENQTVSETFFELKAYM